MTTANDDNSSPRPDPAAVEAAVERVGKWVSGGYPEGTWPAIRPYPKDIRLLLAALSARDEANLIQRGDFTLHSGQHSDFKIDCDALTDTDLETIAFLLSKKLPAFGLVVGVPTGGIRLAKQMQKYATRGPCLIVDDVLTTGTSMEQLRTASDTMGAVIFAREACPGWITPLFSMARDEAAETLKRIQQLSIGENVAFVGICTMTEGEDWSVWQHTETPSDEGLVEADTEAEAETLTEAIAALARQVPQEQPQHGSRHSTGRGSFRCLR